MGNKESRTKSVSCGDWSPIEDGSMHDGQLQRAQAGDGARRALTPRRLARWEACPPGLSTLSLPALLAPSNTSILSHPLPSPSVRPSVLDVRPVARRRHTLPPAMSSSWPPASDVPEGRSGASTPEEYPPQPRTPHTSTFESPLLSPEARDQSFSSRQSRTQSALGNGFVSSPLNPNSSIGIRSRPASRGSTYFNRIASEESQALAAQFGSLAGSQRGSMVLYRLASDGDTDALVPPKAFQNNRDSVISSSGDSVFSISSDSRFPTGQSTIGRGFVPYAFDPELEKDFPDDDDDYLHTPDYGRGKHAYWSWRGILNVGVIILLLVALLALFVCYPLVDFYRNEARNLAIAANTRVNSTGQVPVPTTK